MQAVQIAELGAGTPAGVPEALDVVAGFDTALVHGFGRIGDESGAALSALAAATVGSPLGGAVGDAVAKLLTGSIGPEELGALAAARSALLGAVHDALLARFDESTGRTRAVEAATPPAPAEGNPLTGARAWLQELAITGWRGVDHELIAAVDRTLETLWADPALRRIAVLLDGFAAELRAGSPLATLDHLPTRRWADLWTRAMLLTWRGAERDTPRTVSGRLLPLGVEVHEHGTAVQARVHALLESGDQPPRLVRVSVGAAKVDTIVGPAIWQVLGAQSNLLRALAERRLLTVTDLPSTPAGDLLWHDDRAEPGEVAEPFTSARVILPAAVASAPAPLDRHPVQLGEPVLLENYRVEDGELVLDGHRLRLELENLPGCGPLDATLVSKSSACIALIGWDGAGWSARPLGVEYLFKKATVAAHTGDWALGPTDPKVAKALARSGDTVAVLRERAGRLLRK